MREISLTTAEDMIAGGCWLRRPRPDSEIVVAYQRAVAPEVMAAVRLMAEDRPPDE